MSSDALLTVEGLSVTYGGLKANDDVSLTVRPGQVVGLIGPNGAGKTTFIDAISGLTKLSSGGVRLRQESLTELRPHQRARRGMTRSFQATHLFDDLSVRENVQVAAQRLTWRSAMEIFRPFGTTNVDWALELLGLVDVADRMPDSLSHGQRRLTDVARALVRRPDLVLLDEPAAGLDRDESVQLGRHIREVCDQGISVLLVDHDMALVLDVSDYVYVMHFGRLISQGPPMKIRNDPAVIDAYLGGQFATDEDFVSDAPGAAKSNVEGLT